MADFKAWDVVAVPFPYTDRPVRERRPALVIGAGDIRDRHGLLWVMMITSAANRGWPGDIAISNPEAAGLPAPSVVRTAKVATIEAKEAERLGSLPAKDRGAVRKQLLSIIAQTLEGRGPGGARG